MPPFHHFSRDDLEAIQRKAMDRSAKPDYVNQQISDAKRLHVDVLGLCGEEALSAWTGAKVIQLPAGQHRKGGYGLVDRGSGLTFNSRTTTIRHGHFLSQKTNRYDFKADIGVLVYTQDEDQSVCEFMGWFWRLDWLAFAEPVSRRPGRTDLEFPNNQLRDYPELQREMTRRRQLVGLGLRNFFHIPLPEEGILANA